MLTPLSVTMQTTFSEILNFSICFWMRPAMRSWVWLPNEKKIYFANIFNTLFSWFDYAYLSFACNKVRQIFSKYSFLSANGPWFQARHGESWTKYPQIDNMLETALMADTSSSNILCSFSIIFFSLFVPITFDLRFNPSIIARKAVSSIVHNGLTLLMT